MADDANERIEALEKSVAALTETLVRTQHSLGFVRTISGQAMFTLARVLTRLEKEGILAAAEENGLVAVTHALFLRHEQNELFLPEDREQAKLWREQLGRDA